MAQIFKINPTTGELDIVLDTGVSDARYLKLDQTTPQNVINGSPMFDKGIQAGLVGLQYAFTVDDGGLAFTSYGSGVMNAGDLLLVDNPAYVYFGKNPSSLNYWRMGWNNSDFIIDANTVSSGNILLTPNSKVGVTGNLEVSGNIYNKADNSKHYFGAGDDYSIEWNGSDAVHTITAGDFVFTGGNVGIGTTTPEAKLEVTSSTFPPARMERSTTATSSVLGAIALRTRTSANMADGFGSLLVFEVIDESDVNNYIGSIGAVRAGADDTGDLVFRPYTGGTGYEKMRITSDGNVLIGDTTNAFNTQGLTINQGANDNEILSLKSSDVIHPFTAITEADTYATFLKHSATLGGLRIRGMSDGDGEGLVFYGLIGSNNPTDTTPAIKLAGYKSNAASTTNLGNAETILQVLNGSTALMTVLGSGNVGFGTVSPLAKFHLEGALVSAGAPFNQLTYDTAAMAINVGAGIGFGGDYTSSAGSLSTFSGIRGGKENDISGNNAGYLALHTRASGGNVTEKVRVTSTGDVKLILDSQKLYFGAADDASIYYDGTDLCIDSSEVGSGTIDLKGQTAVAITTETLSEYITIKVNGVSKKLAIVA